MNASIVPLSEWAWYGHAGHFICGRWCRFHLATKVGAFWVSTVGEYVPTDSVQTILAECRGNPLVERGEAREDEFIRKFGFEKLGASGLYETMVFSAGDDVCTERGCNCGQPLPRSWHNLAGDRYDTAREARDGHLSYCQRAAEGAFELEVETADVD